jgi:hypothetical protein
MFEGLKLEVKRRSKSRVGAGAGRRSDISTAQYGNVATHSSKNKEEGARPAEPGAISNSWLSFAFTKTRLLFTIGGRRYN